METDETVNHIISKLAQKEFKTRLDWVGSDLLGIVLEIKTIDHLIKLYIHKSEFVQDNEMYQILSDFGMQVDHLISVRPSFN